MKDEQSDVTRKTGANSKARAAAQAALEGQVVNPTGQVQYHSHGRIAIIGGNEAQEFATRLSKPLKPLVILVDGAEEPGVPTIAVGGRNIVISGYMGEFSIVLGKEGKPNYESVLVDLVLDLSAIPLLSMPIKPPGYFVASTEETSLSSVASQLDDLVGSFEKPRYFDYDASICAHARSGQQGCNRCVEACPAEAITSLSESIQVNPYLCQGGGVCASVCPSGAIRYNYPDAASMMNKIHTLMKTYYENGGEKAVIGFVAEADVEKLEAIPANLLIVVIEELASVGMEVWLSSLAYGAKSVLLINSGSVPENVLNALEEQVVIAGKILDGLGYLPNAIHLMSTQALTHESESVIPDIDMARFAGIDEKRRAAFMAIDHLYEQSEKAETIIPLPDGSSFGAIDIDDQACTLCMSCTSVCPVGAVQAGNDIPQLLFHESKCLQCGICKAACPENAISLTPRLIADGELRRQSRILYKEPAFCCVSCGKSFATNSVIMNILSKLEGHDMFRDERAKRRLQMCEDCRVVDMVQDEAAMQQVNTTQHH